MDSNDFNYSADGILEKITAGSEAFGLIKGNLLSVKATCDIVFEEMNYTVGKDGLPTKAKLLYDTKSSREGANFEFRYTKW